MNRFLPLPVLALVLAAGCRSGETDTGSGPPTDRTIKVTVPAGKG